MKIIEDLNLDFLEDRHLTATRSQKEKVEEILADVRSYGDQALFDFTEQFDGVRLGELRVDRETVKQARTELESETVRALETAADRIYKFHSAQVPESWMNEDDEGTVLGQRITPLESAGFYIPGGTAAYPSSVLMSVLPAKAAGVRRLSIVTPPGKDGKVSPAVLTAAQIAGVDDVYTVGGAQAIAALAYGTETVPKVDMIAGPGNIYVTLAKQAVFGETGIDSLAGPSEITVLADETADPQWVAADLLSQAEHDPLSMVVLVTPSRIMAENVQAAVDEQLKTLPRRQIASEAIGKYGYILLVPTVEKGAEVVSRISPEHLQVMTADAEKTAGLVTNAGAIFIGPYSSEPVGDYLAGPSHVIPTHGTSRFSSPLNVETFIKRSSIIQYSKKSFREQADMITHLARYEGLEGHARAIEARLKKGEGK